MVGPTQAHLRVYVYPTTALLLSGAVSLLEYFEFMVLCCTALQMETLHLLCHS